MDLAQLVMVGQLVSDPKEVKFEEEQMYTDVLIKVYRPYKDYDGNFFYDIFKVSLWRGAVLDLRLAGNVGCYVVISGRIETSKEIINGKEYINNKIIGEKCSFKAL